MPWVWRRRWGKRYGRRVEARIMGDQRDTIVCKGDWTTMWERVRALETAGDTGPKRGKVRVALTRWRG